MDHGFLIDDTRYTVPGIEVVTWRDSPEAAIFTMSPEDGCPRPKDTRIRLIVLHTTTGRMPQKLLPGRGPVGDLAERNARYWATSKRQASAHLVLDHDGSWVQIADLLKTITYHAGSEENPGVNSVSLGIEIAIDHQGRLYEAQMQSLVTVLDALTRHPKIPVPRQFHEGPWPVPHVASRFRGLIAHRDVGNRGEGDCGPEPYKALRAAGYDACDVSKDAHLALWRERQAWLNTRAVAESLQPLRVDGDPGAKTWELAQRFMPPHGQWVQRPGD